MSFVCSICDKKFKTQNTLKSHCNSYHNEQNLECDLCNKLFFSIYTLKRHKKACEIALGPLKVEKEKEIKIKIEEENKHLKERLNEYSLRFSQYESKLSDKDKDIKLLQDQLLKTNTTLIQSKDDLVQTQKQQMLQQQIYHTSSTSNSNNKNISNNMVLNINSISDVELAHYLTPITNLRLHEAVKSTFDNYIDSQPNDFLMPEMFVSDMFSSNAMKKSIICTDRSRSNTAWVNGDENNQLIRDQHGKQLIKKIMTIPSVSNDIHEKINNVLTVHNAIASRVNVENKEETLKTFEKKKITDRFFKQLKHGKMTDKSVKETSKELIQLCPDKTDIAMKAQVSPFEQYKKMDEISIRSKGWTNIFTFLNKHCIVEPYFIFFYDLSQTSMALSKIVKDHMNIINLRNEVLSESRKDYVIETPNLEFYTETIEGKVYYRVYFNKWISETESIKTSMTKDELLDCIKSYMKQLIYIGINGISDEEIKAFNSCNTNRLFEEHHESFEQAYINLSIKRQWL